MEIPAAQLVVVGIGVIAVFVWLATLLKFRELRSLNTDIHIEQTFPYVPIEDARHGVLDAIVNRPQQQFVTHQSPMVEVTERGADFIRLELNEKHDVNIQFQEQYEGTHVSVTCDMTKSTNKGLLLLGQYIALVEPLLIVTACTLLFMFVAKAAMPGLRWQVVQGVHLAHFLWPPFLFMSIMKQRVKSIPRTINQLLLSAELQTERVAAGE